MKRYGVYPDCQKGAFAISQEQLEALHWSIQLFHEGGFVIT